MYLHSPFKETITELETIPATVVNNRTRNKLAGLGILGSVWLTEDIVNFRPHEKDKVK